MPNVPAVCNSCGTFFPSRISVENSRNITFSSVDAGRRCPRCGGSGHIPDGVYNFIGNTIQFLAGPQRSVDELRRLAAILREAQRQGASADEVKREVQRQVPELASIADALPKTRTELYAFIGLVLTVISLLLQAAKEESPPHITVEQVVNIVLQQQTPAETVHAPSAQSGTRPSEPSKGKVGRNSPCPCGSGKKYKKCHGVPSAGSGREPVQR